MSSAAAALLRAILDRASANRNRILLTDCRSVDWQSLTFIGERHEFRFRVIGPDSEEVFQSIAGGLGDADLPVRGQVVADIAIEGEAVREPDGAISFAIEALTIAQ